MRAPRLLIVLLALGTVGGFASGFRSMARWQHYRQHGGYGQECGGGWRGNGWQHQPQSFQQPVAPVVVEKKVEPAPQVVTPVAVPTTTSNPTVNIYVNPTGVSNQNQAPAQQNGATGEQQSR